MPEGSAASDDLLLSRTRTRRDLRVSLGFLLAGLVGLAVYYPLSVTFLFSSPQSPTWTVFWMVIGGTFDVLVALGAVFTIINWQLLRPRTAAAA